MSDFCNTFDLASLIKEPTCYNNPEKPSCIDLILKNKPHGFSNSCVIKTGLSDSPRMILTATKMIFQKLRPRVINYRSYKNFSNENYRKNLLAELSNSGLRFDGSNFMNFMIYVD